MNPPRFFWRFFFWYICLYIIVNPTWKWESKKKKSYSIAVRKGLITCFCPSHVVSFIWWSPQVQEKWSCQGNSRQHIRLIYKIALKILRWKKKTLHPKNSNIVEYPFKQEPQDMKYNLKKSCLIRHLPVYIYNYKRIAVGWRKYVLFCPSSTKVPILE